MKKGIQAFLQRSLGFENYLFVFSLFKIYTLKWDGQEKEGDFNFFLTLLQADDQVLDIGANIGIMSALIARKCKQGKVFAFEPIPQNCKALNRIKKFLRLDNIELFPIALGREKSLVEMEMPIMKGVKMQGLSHVKHESIEGYEEKGLGFQVEQNLLDAMPEFHNIPIAAIKMDVENYEQFVLEGAQNLLKENHPLIYCELWDNENRRKCFEILESLDYKIFVLFQDQLVPFDKNIHLHHNFFFIPRKRTKEFL